MSTILEKLFSKRRESIQRSALDWQELVQRVANETLTDVDEIDAILQKLNRTPEDLQKAVRLRHDREQWQSQVDELPELQAACCAIEAAQKKLVVAADAEVVAIRTRQRIETAELSRQLGIVARKIDAANEATVDLHKTNPPEVKAAELAHAARVLALMNERDSISEDMAVTREFTHGSPGGRGVRYAADERRVAEIDKEIRRLQESVR
jgi:hypothetical protein